MSQDHSFALQPGQGAKLYLKKKKECSLHDTYTEEDTLRHTSRIQRTKSSDPGKCNSGSRKYKTDAVNFYPGQFTSSLETFVHISTLP